MLIIYRKSDGIIICDSGKNDFLPLGPEFEVEVQRAIAKMGGTIDDYAEYRINDKEQPGLTDYLVNSGSYQIMFNELGDPIGVTYWQKVNIDCPASVVINQPVNITASVQGGDGIEAIMYVDGIEKARGLMPVTWSVMFETVGRYVIEVIAGRHGNNVVGVMAE